jgi:hypothetical protein
MGLDARVPCNCWAEGRTKPLPISPELVRVDDEWGSPQVNLSWEDEKNQELRNAFYRWLREACEHPNMEYARVRVSNWAGVAQFRHALARIGWEHFPTLRVELPSANGGSTSPQAAAEALREIALFRELIPSIEDIHLVNSDSGLSFYTYIPGRTDAFFLSGQNHMSLGFDSEGLFIRSTNPPRELFRAKHTEVRQLETLSGEDRPWLVAVEYIDLDSGNRLEWVVPDGWFEEDPSRPLRMHVESRQATVEEYMYIVEPLTEIFNASLEIGNPVYWC